MGPHHDEFWSQEPIDWADDVEETSGKISHSVTNVRPVSIMQPSLGSQFWAALGSVTTYITNMFTGQYLLNEEEEVTPRDVEETSVMDSHVPTSRSVLDFVPDDVFRGCLMIARDQSGTPEEVEGPNPMTAEVLGQPPLSNYSDVGVPLTTESLLASDELDGTVGMSTHTQLDQPTESIQQDTDRLISTTSGNSDNRCIAEDADLDGEDINAQQYSPVEMEYRWRDICDQTDPGIHHWNWLGNPVYERTATPPTDSLAFMQAAPKVPTGSDEMRINAIMNSAVELIDPVAMQIESGEEELLEMHGSELIRVCEGRVSNLYSLNGSWIYDDNSDDILPDLWGILALEPSDYVVGNGVVGRGLIDRDEWFQWRMELQAQNGASAHGPRNMKGNKSTPSSLRNVQLIGDVETPNPWKTTSVMQSFPSHRSSWVLLPQRCGLSRDLHCPLFELHHVFVHAAEDH
ncbi:hypothetical protein N7457_004648 [Penicillium paradoxum]|uniref:uncharacterized protein n=1 Tax=Penicillium paradoxum TaxID=176176 RepID=UPI0025489FEA|nr:uncharacterized protein N7457_004648 [Penicillium paradoxum]KAJ5782874.1 hypothetical protein N7457_004648 [Penicillium paradoxum]